MQIVYQPELLEYMGKEKKHIIVVETVLINHSEFEIMELHVHLIHDKQAEGFRKKRYRSLPTEHGEVLLPPYKLNFQDTVTFGLKKFLFLKIVTYQGITR